MTLESATYINTLSPSAPASSDPRSQGDDHLRLIKQVLQNTFPNASNPFYIPAGQAAQTSNVTVSAPSDGGKIWPMNCSSGNLTVTLPTSGLFDGFSIAVFKSDFGPSYVTLDGNGKTINGESTKKLTKGYQWAILEYNETLAAWIAYIQAVTPTGAFLDSPASSVEGYVMADGASTVGNASSGATVANVTTNALFQLLWNQFADSVCAVSGGRGASASADYAANKKITMPDLRGRSRFGKDNMGGSAASRITSAGSGISGDTLGATGGAQTVTLAQANLPNVTLTLSGTVSGTTSSDGNHKHLMFSSTAVNNSPNMSDNTNYSPSWNASNGSGSGGYTIRATTDPADEGSTSTDGAHTHTVGGTCSGTTSSINGNTAQTAVNKMPPAFIVNVFMAL